MVCTRSQDISLYSLLPLWHTFNLFIIALDERVPKETEVLSRILRRSPRAFVVGLFLLCHTPPHHHYAWSHLVLVNTLTAFSCSCNCHVFVVLFCFVGGGIVSVSPRVLSLQLDIFPQSVLPTSLYLCLIQNIIR